MRTFSWFTGSQINRFQHFSSFVYFFSEEKVQTWTDQCHTRLGRQITWVERDQKKKKLEHSVGSQNLIKWVYRYEISCDSGPSIFITGGTLSFWLLRNITSLPKSHQVVPVPFSNLITPLSSPQPKMLLRKARLHQPQSQFYSESVRMECSSSVCELAF